MSDMESTGHESRDLDVRAVAWFIAGLTVVLIVIFVVLAFFQSSLSGGHVKERPPELNAAPAPRLQTDASAELKDWRMKQEAELNRCRWVDRSAGIIEISIERAMQLTVERGLPARPAATSEGGRP